MVGASLAVGLCVSMMGCAQSRSSRDPGAAKERPGVQAQGPQVAVIYKKRLGPVPAAATSGRISGDRASGCLLLTAPNGARRQVRLLGPWVLRWDPELALYKDGKLYVKSGQDHGFGSAGRTGTPIPGCPVQGIAVDIIY